MIYLVHCIEEMARSGGRAPPRMTMAQNITSDEGTVATGSLERSEDDVRNRCPGCGTPIECVDVTEAVCRDCDIVVSGSPISRQRRPIYGGTDWRERRQTGGVVSARRADRGIGTGTPDGVVDGPGAEIATGRSSRERRLGSGLGEIDRLGAILSIPDVEMESAAVLFREAFDAGLLAGRSLDGFAAACLLAAIRSSPGRIPVSIREVETASLCSPADIGNARGALEVELGVRIPQMDPRDFLPRAASELELEGDVRETADVLLTSYVQDPDAQCRGFSPRTITGAAIHAACDHVAPASRPTLAEIGDAVGASSCRLSERKSYLLELDGTHDRL